MSQRQHRRGGDDLGAVKQQQKSGGTADRHGATGPSNQADNETLAATETQEESSFLDELGAFDSHTGMGLSSLTRQASDGTAAPDEPLPHHDAIQEAFGPYSIEGITAHTDREAAASIGANAYAVGSDVVFGEKPSLETATEEATHALLQGAGIGPTGVGAEGDRYEAHADAVAHEVASGNSAVGLLDQMTGGDRSITPGQATGVQREAGEVAPDARRQVMDIVHGRTGSSLDNVTQIQADATLGRRLLEQPPEGVERTLLQKLGAVVPFLEALTRVQSQITYSDARSFAEDALGILGTGTAIDPNGFTNSLHCANEMQRLKERTQEGEFGNTQFLAFRDEFNPGVMRFSIDPVFERLETRVADLGYDVALAGGTVEEGAFDEALGESDAAWASTAQDYFAAAGASLAEPGLLSQERATLEQLNRTIGDRDDALAQGVQAHHQMHQAFGTMLAQGDPRIAAMRALDMIEMLSANQRIHEGMYREVMATLDAADAALSGIERPRDPRYALHRHTAYMELSRVLEGDVSVIPRLRSLVEERGEDMVFSRYELMEDLERDHERVGDDGLPRYTGQYIERTRDQGTYTELEMGDGRALDRDWVMRFAEEALAEETPNPGDVFSLIQQITRMDPDGQDAELTALKARLQAVYDVSEDTEEALAIDEAQREAQNTEVLEIDLREPLSITNLSQTLRSLANEPGERGRMQLKIRGRRSFGAGRAASVFVEPELTLGVGFWCTDTMTAALGFDAALAIRAGFQLAGIEVSGQAEFGYSAAVRFGNPEDAAAWMLQQLMHIQRQNGEAIETDRIGVEGYDTNETYVQTVGGAAEARLRIGGEDNRLEGSVGGGESVQHYETDEGVESEGRTSERYIQVGGRVEIGGGLSLDGHYRREWSNVEGDVNEHNNGTYLHHQVQAVVTGDAAAWRNVAALAASGTGIAATVSELLGQLQGSADAENAQAEGEDQVASDDYLVSEEVVNELTETLLQHVLLEATHDEALGGLDRSQGLQLDVNRVDHGAGDWRTQYSRISLLSGISVSDDFSLAGFSGEWEFSAETAEVISEVVGTGTHTYLAQLFDRRWTDRDWAAFVEQHADEVHTTIQRTARENEAFASYVAFLGTDLSDATAALEAFQAWVDDGMRQISEEDLQNRDRELAGQS